MDGVENMDASRVAMELVCDPDPMWCLAAIGVLRVIDVIEVRMMNCRHL
jgi:hypothetical protein